MSKYLLDNLRIIGLNHKTAPIEIREKFAFTNKLEYYYNNFGKPNNFVLLNTCNRTEIITFLTQQEQEKKIKDCILDEGNIDETTFDKHFYILGNFKALKHLFKVASGLDSLVIGESQILGQIKDAFDLSMQKNFIDTNFIALQQRILQCAKRVQRETSINKGSLSVPYIATQLAQNIFDDMSSKIALLIGAGEMCELTGVHLQELNVKAINVANRNIDNAHSLANKFNGKAYTLEEINLAIKEADIIISSTSSPAPIISKKTITNICDDTLSSPRLFIDIAVPRDIESNINELDNTFLYNIDDLKTIVEQNRQGKTQQLNKAEKIIQEEIKLFIKDVETNKLAPIIKELKTRLEKVKNKELNKIINKNNLDENTLEQIAQSMQIIINKILHDPIITLRQNVTKKEEKSFIETFKEIFNL